MIALLFLTAFLLAGSGALKLRSAQRFGLTVPLLPLVELVASLVLAGGAFSGALGPRAGFWAVFGAVALVVYSSARHVVRVSTVRRRREASEGSRLAMHLKYFSGPPPGSE